MPKKQPAKRVFNYVPASEKHRAFHHAWKTRMRILCGGYGSAKTHSACAEVLRHLLDNPKFKGQRALVVGLTAGHNEDVLLPEFKKILTYDDRGVNRGYLEGRDYHIKRSPNLKIFLPFGVRGGGKFPTSDGVKIPTRPGRSVAR